VCTPSCNAGFADCDSDPWDGCGENLNTDPNNCGSCGFVCTQLNGTNSCVAGHCTPSCTAGYANCSGNPATGCETNLTNDNNNCGSCGHGCLAACGGSTDHVTGTHCTSSACSVTTCSAGYQDFDLACPNGCECLDSTTPTVCTNATSLFSGTLAVGQSIVPFGSTMAPTTVTQAWFTLTFGNATNSLSYHPKIGIASTNNEFLIDVYTNCSGANITSCTDNGSGGSIGVLNFETSFTGPSPAADPNSALFTNILQGQVWIKVYRRNGVTPTCNMYTITASE
jgi:hypothetical protein